EGFFGSYVEPKGLQHFDEKEVDIRLSISAMDSLYEGNTNAICIVSSDQDFLPIHERADAFNVMSFQADLAKFREDDKIGRTSRRWTGDLFVVELTPNGR